MTKKVLIALGIVAALGLAYWYFFRRAELALVPEKKGSQSANKVEKATAKI